MVRLNFESLLREDTARIWQFLDQEQDPCAVVSSRMELMYINQACQSLVPQHWFARRCFEMLPTTEKLCALDCPTIAAVQTGDGIVYAKERLETDDGASLELGTAVIPLERSLEDSARAILLFRPRDSDADADGFRERLLADARELSVRARDAIR